MAKFYRASITMKLYPEENGLMEWQDEDETPRTEEEMLEFAGRELLERLFNGQYKEIASMIEVEVVEEA